MMAIFLCTDDNFVAILESLLSSETAIEEDLNAAIVNFFPRISKAWTQVEKDQTLSPSS